MVLCTKDKKTHKDSAPVLCVLREKFEKGVSFGIDAGNGFRMRLLHGAQKAMKELYRDVQFFKPVAASIAVCDTYIPPGVPVMA